MPTADLDKLTAVADSLRQTVADAAIAWPQPREIKTELPPAPVFDAAGAVPTNSGSAACAKRVAGARQAQTTRHETRPAGTRPRGERERKVGIASISKSRKSHLSNPSSA